MPHILKISFICLLIAIPQVVFAQQKFKGYPQKNADVRSEFANPPKGYGNVPFYWWNGDSLNRERLKEQLDILASSATDGFTISYIHLDPEVDTTEVKGGYALFGKTEPGRPNVFSEEWWDIWSWFSKECADKGIGLGLDDYTVGWTGNGYYPDELLSLPKFKNYSGELVFTVDQVKAGASFSCAIPQNTISVAAYPENGKKGIELTKKISNGKLSWKAPADSDYRIYTTTTKEGYLIHPDHGKELIRIYFDRFEKKMGDAVENGMNYFFQDELHYPLKIGSWSDDFKDEFLKRKGYDIMPFLPALHEYIGAITPKIRLDYCDVLLDLAEERYFKPIYDWNADRGLIYGSDNFGRGTDPLAYIDYFRANSWYTAPGNDAPSTGSSFLQTKVSSSIAHLHERPRTWLEAFHSMGWGSTGSWLTQQMDHHFMAGGNLVCMHGLYYSTHGGWWEWAPPCFHFRMPYWPHIKKWLEYTERLSYLMSQGTHVCDIALMYPTESMQAYPDANANESFRLATIMSNAGLDYDFINYTALKRSSVEKGVTAVAEEKYKIIILPDMKAMHFSSLQKVLDHYRAGGIVIATGSLPLASTNAGENDKKTEDIIKEVFGLTNADLLSGKIAKKQTNAAGGTGLFLTKENVVSQIHSLITPDFKPPSGAGKVLHRRAGELDIYMVMDVPKDSECFFRTKGKVELWNASDGTVAPYPVVRQTDEGTWLRLEKEPSNSYLFVFSPGEPAIENRQERKLQQIKQTPIDGEWEVELLPTMNNKWGDFRFPAFDGFIGAEARSFRHQPADVSGDNWMMPGFDDSSWTESIYGFGAQVISRNVPANEDIEKAITEFKNNNSTGNKNPGIPVEFSWQYGVWDNPGGQGWHGLKGKVNDGFLILAQGGHQLYKTYIYAPQQDAYRIETAGIQPYKIIIDDNVINGNALSDNINLTKGWHQMIIVYTDTRQTDYNLTTLNYRDPRERSAVVLFPASSPSPKHPSAYDPIISTKWKMGNHLMYDPYGEKNNIWNYRFKSVPGVSKMEFTIAGKNLQVWFDGKQIQEKNIQIVKSNPNGANTYQILFDNVQKRIGTVAFSIERETGYQGAAALLEPIKLSTETGLLASGNWSKTGALKHYSGGMYYRKKIELPEVKTESKIILNLGSVTASCELKINGKDAGILMSSPYSTDITPYIKAGVNEIEVLVYSTLSNHYQTIPTPFRGNGEAGLIGPASWSVME